MRLPQQTRSIPRGRGHGAVSRGVIPSDKMADYGVGYENAEQYRVLRDDCHNRFRGQLLPCDTDEWDDYLADAGRGTSWSSSMCCWGAPRR